MPVKLLLPIMALCAYTSPCGESKSITPVELSRGTIIVAAVGRDGIVLATDSRIAKGNSITGLVDFYRDSACKILKINGFVVSCVGVTDYDKENIWNIAKEYDKSAPHHNAYWTLSTFIDYLTAKYPLATHPWLRDNGFFIAGYH